METENTVRGKSRIPGVLRVLLFLAIFAVLFWFVNKLMYSKDHREYYLASANEEPGTVDMVTVGSSHVYHALYSMQLFRDYGIASVNQGISGQHLDLTPATVEEVIRRHHPKMIVMDIYMAKGWGRTSDENAHKMLDNMLDLPLKIRTVLENYPAKKWEEFLFPFSVYHNRWEELGKEDVRPLNLLSKGSKEEITYEFREDKQKQLDGFSLTGEDETKEMDKKTLKALKEIRDLCRENDVQLVFIVVPYFADEEHQKAYNGIRDWCAENGIGYFNYLNRMEEIGVDLATGMRDAGHMNWFGGKAVTDALGKDLTENYDLPDRRGDPKYASWEDNIPKYNAYLEAECEKIGVTFSY